MWTDLKKRIRDYYGPIASQYYEKYHLEVLEKACDKLLLDQLIKDLPKNSKILDVGSGSSCQQANYLARIGFDVSAIDLVEENVVFAHATYPHLMIEVMDMTKLTHESGTFLGISAFYCIGHLPQEERVIAFKEFHRTLQEKGKLALVVHRGSHNGIHERDHVYFKAFDTNQLISEVTSCGFRVLQTFERDPLPTEMAFGRIYLLAERVSI